MFELKNSRVLVIGGAGFIGSHVVEELLKEDVKEVIIYDNFVRGKMKNLNEALKDPRCKIYEYGGDIRDIDILNSAMKGIDYVFHLAALWLLQCYDFPRAAFETNIAGTFNVIEACKNNNVKKLVFSSSASVYGNALEIPMKETHPFNNETFYGATKIAGEQMLHAFHKRYGLNYVGLRYMNVYGPRQDYNGAYVSVIMKMLDKIDAGEQPEIYGDGSQTYDFIHVRDVAKANIAALKADVTSGFYNIGTGKGTSIKDLAEMLIKLTNFKGKIKYVPQGKTFVTHRIGSTEKAEKDLGFKATIELEEGLKSLIEWRKKDKKERKI
ncbi:NAD dependent epimerase/dehydratase family protein [Thermosipho africanus Ob7]|uniref:NAD-dependent epimerase/dehydratase family protein n=1 Tax=Thermosipho africanus TaxID=2421 RepID=UPI000E0C979A|nr:NAD-dependent epimerase/dehydratase family protein [Thermosipho africanus]RDI90110.1 NAD dependent epimerase/dehydratase family protein [Thermosipho africanus Ob7]